MDLSDSKEVPIGMDMLALVAAGATTESKSCGVPERSSGRQSSDIRMTSSVVEVPTPVDVRILNRERKDLEESDADRLNIEMASRVMPPPTLPVDIVPNPRSNISAGGDPHHWSLLLPTYEFKYGERAYTGDRICCFCYALVSDDHSCGAPSITDTDVILHMAPLIDSDPVNNVMELVLRYTLNWIKSFLTADLLWGSRCDEFPDNAFMGGKPANPDPNEMRLAMTKVTVGYVRSWVENEILVHGVRSDGVHFTYYIGLATEPRKWHVYERGITGRAQPMSWYDKQVVRDVIKSIWQSCFRGTAFAVGPSRVAIIPRPRMPASMITLPLIYDTWSHDIYSCTGSGYVDATVNLLCLSRLKMARHPLH
jgi:hypothetical protein